jgi:hypothetical protein
MLKFIHHKTGYRTLIGYHNSNKLMNWYLAKNFPQKVFSNATNVTEVVKNSKHICIITFKIR